ncbi:hypothetical protein [Marinobacter salsuginis]|jgi:hypothetical protein|uniref:Uncharacterized protein n=1 Tax=Marinobacter salsuginis TaxID=418719 RepID=A0A5M3Q0G4_9GAMM|nr:hypothetical protein [Marinobacter salsuginis]GBO88715.1 hypothetical protein MSSD14B_23830 [Marinobacter salsuginis]
MLQRTNIINAARDAVAKLESEKPGAGLEEMAHAFRVLIHKYVDEWDLEDLTEEFHLEIFTYFPALPGAPEEETEHE